MAEDSPEVFDEVRLNQLAVLSFCEVIFTFTRKYGQLLAPAVGFSHVIFSLSDNKKNKPEHQPIDAQGFSRFL